MRKQNQYEVALNPETTLGVNSTKCLIVKIKDDLKGSSRLNELNQNSDYSKKEEDLKIKRCGTKKVLLLRRKFISFVG